MTPKAAENELIRKALMGDDESFEALLFSCRTKAYNLAFRYLKNHEDASDALQESFIKIYRNLAGFKGESSFDTWVYRIVVNTCNDMIKKNKGKACWDCHRNVPHGGKNSLSTTPNALVPYPKSDLPEWLNKIVK